MLPYNGYLDAEEVVFTLDRRQGQRWSCLFLLVRPAGRTHLEV